MYLKRSETAKQMLEKGRFVKSLNEPDKETTFPVKGTRLVDLEIFVKNLYCKGCKEKLLIHSIEEETIVVGGSIYHIRCHNCLLVNVVKSSEEYENPITGKKVFALNSKAVLGKEV